MCTKLKIRKVLMHRLTVKRTCYALIAFLGLVLTCINIYGVFQDIRPSNIQEEELRFGKFDLDLELERPVESFYKRPGEGDEEYSQRVTKLISANLAHIHWERYDPSKFNQLVPIWENYFLYFMGRFSGIPEFYRYHFADYERSLKRGIGICGDASMIMSQLLDKAGIDNQLYTFPGHVIVGVNFQNGTEKLFDPDFGVSLNMTPNDVMSSPAVAAQHYIDAGYYRSDYDLLLNVYNNEFKSWDNVRHFITKKYYFEKVSYWLKWPLPLLMMFPYALLLWRERTA